MVAKQAAEKVAVRDLKRAAEKDGGGLAVP